MRLTCFHPQFRNLGGAELLAAQQAMALQEAGHEVSLLTFEFREAVWRGHLPGIPVTVLGRRHWTDLLALGSSHRKWLGRARRAHAALAGAGTVLAHNPPAPAILGHAPGRGPRFWYCHEAPWRLHPEASDYFLIHRLDQARGTCPPGLFQALEEARAGILARARGQGAMRAYDLEGVAALGGILANSRFCAHNLEAIYSRGDIRVVPPMVAAGGHPHRPGLDPEGLQVLTLSRLELLKNVETVVRGFARFAALGQGRPRLRVVGDGRERPALEALVRELGVQDRVEFFGYLDAGADRERLDALFQASDLFALLPLDESFGLVYPEAAARGLLLAGPDHGGPLEILEGGELGWTLPPLSPEAFCGALEAAWALPGAEVDRMRERAAASCRRRFAPEVVTPLLENALGMGHTQQPRSPHKGS